MFDVRTVGVRVYRPAFLALDGGQDGLVLDVVHLRSKRHSRIGSIVHHAAMIG
jgi:hypothetical protein